MEECGQDRKRHRGAKDKDLEAAVMTWFTQSRVEGVPLSGPVIQGQAMKFNKMLNPDDEAFTGSNGWLRGFKERHGISQVTIRGEQRSADDAAADAYPAKLKHILEEGQFCAEQVYNADETGLYFKMLPDKTLATKDDSTKTLGYKQSKNRLTALLCCNQTGNHKLAPLIIGKSAKPRCFHHVNMKTLPAVHNNSKNAWMTSGASCPGRRHRRRH